MCDQSSCVSVQVDEFLSSLINYDKENIPEVCQRAIQPYLHDKDFDPEFIRSKSQAAAGLCAWVINIMKFFEVFCEVSSSDQSVLSLVRRLSTRHCPHLLLSAVLRRRCCWAPVPAAVDRYVLAARRAAAAVDRWDRRTDGLTDV